MARIAQMSVEHAMENMETAESVETMETDDEGPAATWRMVVAPMTALFHNVDSAERELEVLMTSFVNSRGDFADMVVSREADHSRFNRWLLSRLFYILSREKLKRIHPLSIQVQLTILHILYVNEAPFYSDIVNAYLDIFRSLVEFYSDTSGRLQLRPFTVNPNRPNEKSNSQPDLTPLTLCLFETDDSAPLIQHILDILCRKILTMSRFRTQDDADDKIFILVSHIIQNFDIDLKMRAIDFYINILNRYGFHYRPESMHHFLVLFHSAILNWTLAREPLNAKICAFLDAAITSGPPNGERKIVEVLISICKTVGNFDDENLSINLNDNNSTFPPELVQRAYKIIEKIIKTNESRVSLQFARNPTINVPVAFTNSIVNLSNHHLTALSNQSKNSKSIVFDVFKTNPSLQIALDTAISNLKTVSTGKCVENIDKPITDALALTKVIYNSRLKLLEHHRAKCNKLLLQFIPKDKVHYFVKCISLIINNEPPISTLTIQNIMTLAMYILLISTDVGPENLAILVQIECFFFDGRPITSSNTCQFEIFTHSLNLLLTHILLKNDSNNKDRKITVIKIIESYDKKNPAIFNKILMHLPLLVLNNIFPLSEIITDFLNLAVSFINDDSVFRILIDVLPATLCCMLSKKCTVIQSSEKLQYENCVPATTVDGFHTYIICSQCLDLSKSAPSNNEVDLKWLMNEKNNRIILLMEKQQDEASIKNATHQLEQIFNKILSFSSSKPIDTAQLVLAFIKHSVALSLPAYSLWCKKNVLEMSNIFTPLITSIMMNTKMDKKRKDEISATTINIILAEVKQCLESNDIARQDACLNTIYSLGSAKPESTVLLPSIKLFLFFLMHPRSPHSSTASIYIKNICDLHQKTSNATYHRYKKDICRIMMDLTVYNFSIGHSFASSMSKVIRTFGFVGFADFLSKEFHHALPFLIPAVARSLSLRPIIEEIASLIPCRASKFVTDRFPQIYIHIYLHESEENAKMCCDYIEQITHTKSTMLVHKYSRLILTELLLQYSCNEEKVTKACKWLAQSGNDKNPSPSPVTLSHVADFIQPKFLGVLASFDNKLVHEKIALSVKRKALKSLPLLLHLMGPVYMTPLKLKILATLSTAISSSLLRAEFPDLIADACNAFVRNVDIVALGPILPAIFACLLPLISHSHTRVHRVFEYLVISNENMLSGFFADLFFIDKIENVDTNIKQAILKHVKKKMPENFIEKIRWYCKYLHHDTVEIKIYALEHLHELIGRSRKEMDCVIFGSKRLIDPSFVELFEILIAGCRDKDEKLALWSGRCLGQMGALQPSMLPQRSMNNNGNSNMHQFTFSIKDVSFAKMALFELIRAFQFEKRTKDMDCYSLAIQEILKSYNISPEGENKDLWESFPENMQQIMKPLLSSRYTISFPTNPTKTCPIYGSDQSHTFNEWALNWVRQLIPQTVNDNTQDLLRMIYPALKKDFRALILFLPYIILHIILSKNDHEEISEIRDEILAVIGLQSFGGDSNDISNTISGKAKKIMRNVNLSPSVDPLVIEEGTHIKCCKIIYNLLDYLNRWLREWCWIHKKRPSLPTADYKKICKFVEQFCPLTIAKGNVLCGELKRALLYLETYMEKSAENFQEQLTFLAEIYATLNEPDAVSGIMSMKQNEPSLGELILAHQVTGRLQDAATCYEKYAQHGEMNSEQLQGMVQIYLELDQPYTALQLLRGAANDDSFPIDEALAAEPFWRLGMFENLDKLLKDRPDISNDDRWGVSIGHCLLALRNGSRVVFEDKLKEARFSALRRLEKSISYTSAEDIENYCRGYLTALDLHMIAEIEHVENTVYKLKTLQDTDGNCEILIKELIENWNYRIKMLQSSGNTVEPVLRLRRILLEESKVLLSGTHPRTSLGINKHLGTLWLRSAKFARKASIFQQAYIYILNGEKYSPKELFIEKAKFYWMKGQQEAAFSTLKRGLEEHFSEDTKALWTSADQKLCAKAKLLIAIYNNETINVDMDVNISNYKDAVEVYREWEKSLVCLGEYYEKVYAAFGNDEKRGKLGLSTRAYALDCYGKALQHGNKRLYQSMPRMLSIWLDFEIPSNDDTQRNIAMANLSQICSMIETFTERLPLYLFLPAFSQIISRICHPVKQVYFQLKTIITKLILAYPQHALWMMMCVIKSSYPERIKRCQEILKSPLLKEPKMQKLISDFNLFAEKLIELCNKTIPDGVQMTHVSTLVRTLPRLLDAVDFSHIMIPHDQFIKIVHPFNSSHSQPNNEFTYNPANLIYITGIEDQVTVLPSLQRPRRVTLKGSDGKKYIVMLKPKDDLRKDFRLMEFNSVVNRYLQECPDARQRRLYIRTYTVLPLNEECGLIQWIPNLLGLRPILMDIYKNKGIHVSSRELKQMMCSNKDSLAKKRAIFEGQLLPKHPPVFGEWFKYTFHDPHSWYQARSAYIRTTAVMSMVGYILGLGDRHGENILFDSTNGDTVHVDFNCLFNRGEEFEWPERVPFRLTHNMQSAMGPLGHEGMYRKSCEVTLKVLRAQTATLMSVIKPFVYDPLVSWQGRSYAGGVGERTNQLACEHLLHIEQRLKGMVRTKGKQFSLSLSPEGQTNNLILEAISVTNLCQMYVGWGPYL